MLNKIIILLLTTLISSITLANDVLIIKNVKISASNKNAGLARTEALEKGQLKAFQELVKLYYPNVAGKAINFTEAEIFNTVEGFKLSKEQRSSTNYFAQMTVKFSKEQIEKLMNNIGGNFSNNQIKEEEQNEIIQKETIVEENKTDDSMSIAMDTLLIPLLEENGTINWFDDENKWLEFWHNKSKNTTSNKFTLPIGDLEDISLLNENILNKNLIELASLYEKYSINNIALLKLKINDSNLEQKYSLSVDYINRFSHSWQHCNFPAIEKTELSSVMQEYYQEMLKFQFKTTESFSDSLTTIKPQIITIDFPIEHISDWTTLEQILSNIKYISNINLEIISTKYYRFSLTYIVELEKLNEILKSYKLKLQDEYNGRYSLIKGE